MCACSVARRYISTDKEGCPHVQGAARESWAGQKEVLPGGLKAEEGFSWQSQVQGLERVPSKGRIAVMFPWGVLLALS